MRTVWFVVGGAAGVYVSTRTRRAAEALTVDGLHDRLTGWFAGARVLRDEFQAGREEKQDELRERLALGPTGAVSGHELGSATVRVLPAARPL